MLGAVTALVAGLFVLALAVEIFVEQYVDLVSYGNQFTPHGWRVFISALMRAVVACGLFWVFARLGGSKPLPRFARSH
jgi:hypothetical protein